MFDINQEISLKVASPECEGGYKTATVRFPTDQEWIARQRQLRVQIRQLGRGNSKTTVLNAEEVDGELLSKIRLGDGPDFDGAEAAAIIRRLAKAEAGEAEKTGVVYSIPVTVPGEETVHRLRMATEKQRFNYRRAAFDPTDGPHGRQEIRMNLQAAGDLYDALTSGAEGYSGPVPIIHKQAAIAELLQEMALEEEDENPL